MKPIYVASPTGHLRATTRLTKLLDVLLEMGVPVTHLAWRREVDEPVNPNPVKTIPILEGGGYKTAGLYRWYLRYIAATAKSLRDVPDGSCVYALSFWSAFPTALAARRKKLRFIFDNNDNISLAYNWPGPMKSFAQMAERFTVQRSALHLVPSHARWASKDSNLRVIPNVPSADAMNEAIRIAHERGWDKSAPFTVYVNGWLPAERGLGPITKALKRLDPSKVRVLLAGRIDAPEGHIGRELSSLPMVTDLGKLSNAEALAHYMESHLCLTYYDPAIPINRLAEANKWGDCILTRTAILVNNEVVTAKPYRDVEGSFGTPYEDDEALADLIKELAANPQRAIAAGERLAQIKTEPWDIMMRRLLEELARA